MTEPTGAASDAATSIFNLPDYRVISATVLDDGSRQIIIERNDVSSGYGTSRSPAP